MVKINRACKCQRYFRGSDASFTAALEPLLRPNYLSRKFRKNRTYGVVKMQKYEDAPEDVLQTSLNFQSNTEAKAL